MIEQLQRLSHDVGEALGWTRVDGHTAWAVGLLVGLFVLVCFVALRIPGPKRFPLTNFDVASHYHAARMTVSRVIHWRRARRLRLGLCLRCGYPIEHTSGRCPECGP